MLPKFFHHSPRPTAQIKANPLLAPGDNSDRGNLARFSEETGPEITGEAGPRAAPILIFRCRQKPLDCSKPCCQREKPVGATRPFHSGRPLIFLGPSSMFPICLAVLVFPGYTSGTAAPVSSALLFRRKYSQRQTEHMTWPTHLGPKFSASTNYKRV